MNPFQVLGTYPVVMRGRKRIFQRLCNQLTKPTPDHVAVVGPKHIGKTVLLKDLSESFTQENDHYLTAVYWDLRHGTPISDSAFKQSLAKEIGKALEKARSDLAQELKKNENGAGDVLATVFEILEDESHRLLVVLDGFDRVLAGARLTRNLWDYMRDLAGRRSLRLVTGSQKRLQELCKTEDSRTSDFWEIFYDAPIRVGPFGEDDWEDILSPFTNRGISFKKGASKELVNWTGGVPVLTAALLSRLHEQTHDGVELSNTDINELGERVLEHCRDILGGLWEDCTADIQADLAALADEGHNASCEEIPAHRLQALQERGYVIVSGSRVKSCCRVMQRYAGQQKSQVENMQRLFGSHEKFEGNIRSLLELRLSQLRDVDQKLYRYVERAIRDLQPEPELAINGMRGIGEYALDLVWIAELPSGRTLPLEWVEQWKHNGENLMDEIADGKVPSSMTGQCRLLQLMTGTQKSKRIAKFITRPTYLLIDHLQSVGHFGQHIEGNPVTLSFAASICLTAIALCQSLVRDFNQTI